MSVDSKPQRHIRTWSVLLVLALTALLSCQQKRAIVYPKSQNLQGPAIDAPAATPVPGRPSSAALKVAPSDPAELAKMAAAVPKPAAKDGYTSVGFEELAGFVYDTDEQGRPTPGSTLPKSIQDLDKTEVAVSGFVVPIDYKDDKVSSMILVRNQLLCCFGQEPKLNEWVFVNSDPPVDIVTDVPVTLYGKLYASPDREGEQVVSLYRMQAEAMDVMP